MLVLIFALSYFAARYLWREWYWYQTRWYRRWYPGVRMGRLPWYGR